MTADLPPISVVVIGRNEGDRLVACLRSINESEYPRESLEVIYVDTNSTDDSLDRAKELGAKVISINPKRPCAAAGRNAGSAVATHGLVHFFDGDTIIHPRWFHEAVEAMKNSNVACVFGRREEIAPSHSIYNFWTHHDWYVVPGKADSCAGDALFRKDVLLAAEGYDESLIAGEEPDLCYRIRSEQSKVILSVDAPMTRHDMGMTKFRQYWTRCTRTGHAYAEVGGRHRGMHSWRQARWKHPIHVVGGIVALVVSIVLPSWWPFSAWVFLEAVAWFRNACRLRVRVGTMRDALRYSLHHYLSKLPITVGMCGYWVRAFFRRSPRALVEYRN